MDIINIVRREVKRYTDDASQSIAHRLDHFDRVVANALLIAQDYPAVDMESLHLAAMLHDVHHPFNDKKNHVRLSIARATQILKEAEYPSDKGDFVLKIIYEHSTEHIDEVKPTSIEAMILFDADKVDGVGASGIGRLLSLFGQLGKTPLESIDWYRMKISKAVNNLQTAKGRQMFQEGLIWVDGFLDRLRAENANVRL